MEFHWSTFGNNPSEYRRKKLVNAAGDAVTVTDATTGSVWHVRKYKGEDIYPGEVVYEAPHIWALCFWLNANEYWPA